MSPSDKTVPKTTRQAVRRPKKTGGAVIFDFDGTIANSFDYSVAFLSREAGVTLNKDQKEALHGLSLFKIARRLGIAWPRLPGLFFKGRRQMRPAIRHIEPYDGIADVIRDIHDTGHELFILSTNTAPNIRKFLRQHGMEDYFSEVYGGVGMFGKAPALRRLLREQHIQTRKAVYIGDELRDAMAAQSVGLRIIAVAWGFARPTDLKAQGVAGLARKPRDILRLLEKL